MNTIETTPEEGLTIAKDLARENLFDSAQLWAGFVLSRLEKSPLTQKTRFVYCETLVLFGDCLVQNHEYRRSFAYYEKAISSFSGTGYRVSEGNGTFLSAVRYRYAQACIKAKDSYTAISLLEKIPLKNHSLSSLKSLASLLENNHEITKANQCYMEILRQQPHAIEAAQALLRNGIAYADLPEGCRESSNSPDVQKILKSVLYEAMCDYEKSTETLKYLEKEYPSNPEIIGRVACNLLMNGDAEGASYHFAKLRKLEPDNTNRMAQYALLLKQDYRVEELIKLCEDVFKASPDSSESWLCNALVCRLREDSEQTLSFICKALELDPRNILAFQLQGETLLSLNRPAEAITSFRHAYRLRRDILTYEGMVSCYLTCRKYSEALVVANEAVTLFPKCARAFVLLGRVCCFFEERWNVAKKHLDKALSLNPRFLEAILCLTELYERQEKDDEAISLLEKTSQTHTSHLIHLRLAKFYASPRLKDYEKAMEHATLAVKLNPNDPLAQAALADLNKWVNDEEDEENVEGEEDDEGEVDEEEGVEVEMEGDEMEAEVDS